eukprot:1937181-Pleurochrysis_carterae.AAC.1
MTESSEHFEQLSQDCQLGKASATSTKHVICNSRTSQDTEAAKGLCMPATQCGGGFISVSKLARFK